LSEILVRHNPHQPLELTSTTPCLEPCQRPPQRKRKRAAPSPRCGERAAGAESTFLSAAVREEECREGE
jgi:hypothetical protein